MENVDDVAAAILSDVGVVDSRKLQKLLYYSQAWHLAITDEPLFADPLEAWRHGPVVVRVWQRHRGRRYVETWPDGDERHLSESARQVVDLVCAHYGDLNGEELSTLTHAELPWQLARGDASPDEALDTPISIASITDCYRGRQLGGRTSQDLAAGGLELSARSLTPEERAVESDTLNKLREDGRQRSLDDNGYSHDVIGRGQTDTPSASALERVARLRAARTR